ncbi:ribosomal RNA large subunit methyltransferase J [Dictyocaulus viviparus]|uniref:Putative rRNA methyltransferase n=1 Tax=Dictyocaulus viviparus TaxID=29172 RepID=A0A0D8XAU6_DICVI|nr:ribosomal RNA large subunit methyltransferase J [Dictyocaulus viviparus]
MGKKVKVGKQRRDKYYKLAKEAGYRSRAAFKLIQLNKRFEFLQNSRATVDLCAAPGGWMQVATQNMPVPSLIIGVDLVPIKPIANCITLQGDITAEKTIQAIKKELQRWEADCVLHDGAPNIGTNWIHDAFQQNCLVLSALKVAAQILRKNGTFVTKVFRSSDYSCLITTLEKLFKRVNVWKPAASRLESAEIFVVCEKYLKPVKVSPELLDPKKVFAEVVGNNVQNQNPQILLLGKKEKKAKAEGYEDETMSMYKKIDATTFIKSSDYLELLQRYNEITLDQEKWINAAETTEEIREYLKDIKVCGPRELRILLRWRKAMRKILEQELKSLEEDLGEVNVPVTELNEDELEDKEMAEIDRMIAKASEDERVALKKKKKRLLKAKAKIIKRRQLKMTIEGDVPDQVEDRELFSLKNIRKAREIGKSKCSSTQKNVEQDEDERNDSVDEYSDYEEDEMSDEIVSGNEIKITNSKKECDEKGVNHTKDADNVLDFDNIVEFDTLAGETKKEAQARKWFQKEEIAELLSDEDDDDEIDVIEKYMERNVKDRHLNTGFFFFTYLQRYLHIFNIDSVQISCDDVDVPEFKQDDGLSTLNEDEKAEGIVMSSKFSAEMTLDDEEMEDDNRVAKRATSKPAVGEDLQPKPKKRRLTPEQLALGEKLIYSSKSAREVEEYANNDEGLPDWFVEDERKHYRKELPVTKEQVQEYRNRLKELNARPCKKVAEAKERKRRRLLHRMQAARKKAEKVLENENLEPLEKAREMKKIYATANKKERKKTELVVVTKGRRGRISRPHGRYKLVDSRLKKDIRALNKKGKTKSRNGKPRTVRRKH